GAASSAATPGGELGGLSLELVTSGLVDPIGLENAGDGSNRLFALERSGGIRLIEGGSVAERPYLDITERVRASYEEGLLGLAFHPDFADNGRLFIHYTSLDGRSVVAELAADPAEATADAGSERLVLDVPNRANNHNGGRLAFGPDGYLYLSLGDDAEPANGQDTSALNGKLLRIDVDTGDPYAIPDDNPFADGGGAGEVWAYGLRNPWRFSFDRANGDVWIGDVGAGAREEIDRAPAGEGGLNFGWPVMEGSTCATDPDCDPSPFAAPVADYGREAGDCVVIGGFVYRGDEQALLVAQYVAADLCTGRLWTIDAAAAAADGSADLVERGTAQGLQLSAFGEDEAGELYAVDLAAGGLYRVVAEP
ncbi:MAG: PQQ-dependent sugar dehydrogenase, partial [Chloroflexota bacterium]|nr:PQQ-dependent sugar dehydrogenase [Chloroflexota bacterium]